MIDGDWHASYRGSDFAHDVPNKVVRAYNRTQFAEMRRILLEAWSRFAFLASHAGNHADG